MLYCPCLSPFRASRQLPGGAFRSSSLTAACNICSLRCDTREKSAATLPERCPSNSIYVSRHLNEIINCPPKYNAPGITRRRIGHVACSYVPAPSSSGGRGSIERRCELPPV